MKTPRHPPHPPPVEAALLYYDDVAIISPPDTPDASEQALLDALETILLRLCAAQQIQNAA